MKKQDRLLRFGVLGCGPISQIAHFDACRKARNAELYAICDLAEDLVQKMAAIHEPKAIYTDLDRMLSDPQVEAVIVGTATFPGLAERQIAELAVKYRLPSMFAAREYVDAGGLMSYGTNFSDLYERAATYVDKILKGAKPRELPVEQPATFELVVNLKTAKALGITIPETILLRADEVID